MALVIAVGYTWQNGSTLMPTRLNQPCRITIGANALAGSIAGGALGEIGFSTVGLTMLQAATAADQRFALGLGGAALLEVGIIAGSVCAGDDSRLSNSRQCNNAFDNAATARVALGILSMALRDVTIATGDPSGGADGDVWFKYTP